MTYPKNSFDRFGDDLCELIVSYLKLEDKLRFQYLSKQWTRVVFNRQNHLKVDVRQLMLDKGKTLKIISKKCPNIRSIVLCDPHHSVKCLPLQTITENWSKLWSITLWDLVAYDQCLDQFFDKFGLTLKDLRIYWFRVPPKGLISTEKCVNLRSLSIFDFHYGIDWSKQVFHRLKRLAINRYLLHTNRFIAFLKNHQNLEAIDIRFRIKSNLSLNFIDVIALHLKRLKSIELYIDFQLKSNDEILKSLEQIGVKCKELKRFDITLSHPSIPKKTLAKMLVTLKLFGQLKRLSIVVELTKISDFVVQSDSFRCCPQLTHLTIRLGFISITDQFFKDFSKNLPRLRYLKIFEFWIPGISESMTKELSKATELRHLGLTGCRHRCVILIDFEEFLIERPKLEIIFE